jgi:hypothetical protein
VAIELCRVSHRVTNNSRIIGIDVGDIRVTEKREKREIYCTKFPVSNLILN